jgi:LysM repeat protein
MTDDARQTARSLAGHLGTALAVTALVLLIAPGARAVRYRPKPDETLAQIARVHYGSSKKMIYLMPTNRITDPAQVSKRKRLWIPTVWRYRIKRGDSLTRLARKYLKDASRAEFLMWLNRIQDPKDLEVGRLITMPFLIRHRVQEGQNMVDLAKRYYFRAKPAGLLRKFNQKRTNALKPGEIILIPIYDPEAASDKVKQRVQLYEERMAKAAEEARERAKRMAASKVKNGDKPPASDTPADPQPDKAAPDESPDAGPTDDPTAVLEDPASTPDARSTSDPGDQKLVREAFELYRDGEYELARANLVRALERARLATPDETEAREVLAHCLVALERPTEAEHEFVRLLMIAPDRTLDPVTTSPKVLEVFRKAKGSK